MNHIFRKQYNKRVVKTFYFHPSDLTHAELTVIATDL